MDKFIGVKQSTVDNWKNELTELEKKPFWNRNKIKRVKGQIQALTEGQRQDILVAGGASEAQGSDNIDKNNYATYSGQVNTINDMYNNRTDYGGEFLRSLIDFRVATIAGANISVMSTIKGKKGEELVKWINDFFSFNKYHGSRLIEDVTVSDMEGKCLLTVKPIAEFKNIRIRSYAWYKTPYDVEMHENDNQRIKSVAYQPNEGEAKVDLGKPHEIIYIKTGGSPDRINFTVPRIANCLTEIENISRTRYDLRKNNHLFGKSFLNFQTNDLKEAKALNNIINAIQWVIGKAYAGTAKASYVEPSGKAQEVLMKEIIQGIKIISLNTGIPVQLLAYPELLSQRSTAENMLEMVNAATIKERTKWEEGLEETVRKAMAMAFEKGWAPMNEPNGFVIKLDLISYANLKQISETWLPLMLEDVISMDTLRSLLPSIDPQREKKLIEAQKQENIDRFSDSISQMRQEDEDTEDDETDDESDDEKNIDDKKNSS
jgi:hypothetical protein